MGTDLGTDYVTPFYLESLKGHLEIASRILTHMADVSTQDEDHKNSVYLGRLTMEASTLEATVEAWRQREFPRTVLHYMQHCDVVISKWCSSNAAQT